MKHAYLILAHQQFDLLDLLISCLDDERNDLFIHFDKKVSELPNLKIKSARLFILEERIDIRWGDVSMMNAELLLLSEALKKGSYAYLHLLSGSDLPLKSQDYIHRFFAEHNGKQFLGYYNGGADSSRLERKVQRRHIFSDSFKGSGLFFHMKRILRFLFLRFQFLFGLRRNEQIEFKKGTQWFSITSEFAQYILKNQKDLSYIYADSYCCDEIFMQTLLWHSPFAKDIFDTQNEARGCMRFIGWKDNQLLDFTEKDRETLLQSDALFARKFNNSDMTFLKSLLKELKV